MSPQEYPEPISVLFFPSDGISSFSVGMKPHACLLSLFAVLVFTGCQSPRLPAETARQNFYPIGIYCVDRTNDFASVQAAGFNVITGPATKEFLDDAQANGLKVLASPGTTAGPDFDPARARSVINAVGGHPALWAWYLVDEPDLNLISPEQVRRTQRFVKSLCPTKPTALVIYKGDNARDYANIADVTMVDRYPIPWLPLASFGQHVEMTRLALPPEKPLVAVIQAFDWNTARAELPDEKNTTMRPPTYAELRCMTYEALARGANGLFYFAFDTGAWKIREQTETWNALQRVVAEVNARLPLFRAEQLWWPKRQRFADPEQRFNAALQASITSCRLRVRNGNAFVPAGDYILAVNNTERAQNWSFTLPPGESVTAAVPVLDENRQLSAVEGWVSDDFKPYMAHVFGPLP